MTPKFSDAVAKLGELVDDNNHPQFETFIASVFGLAFMAGGIRCEYLSGDADLLHVRCADEPEVTIHVTMAKDKLRHILARLAGICFREGKGECNPYGTQGLIQLPIPDVGDVPFLIELVNSGEWFFRITRSGNP